MASLRDDQCNMRAFDLDPTIKWLFCFAHPDDELAVAVWIRRLREAGADVGMYWAHHTSVRHNEAVLGAKQMNVADDRIWFGSFADGQLCDDLSGLVEDLRQRIEERPVDRVACASFEQGHLDHDALNFAVSRAFSGPVFEFPEYWPYTPWVHAMNRFAHPHGEEVISLTPEEQSWKMQLAQSYPSQAIWKNLVWFERWLKLTGRHESLVKTERMRLQTELDYRTVQLPDPWKSRTEKSRRWQRWLAAVDAFEHQPRHSY